MKSVENNNAPDIGNILGPPGMSCAAGRVCPVVDKGTVPGVNSSQNPDPSLAYLMYTKHHLNITRHNAAYSGCYTILCMCNSYLKTCSAFSHCDPLSQALIAALVIVVSGRTPTASRDSYTSKALAQLPSRLS